MGDTAGERLALRQAADELGISLEDNRGALTGALPNEDQDAVADMRMNISEATRMEQGMTEGEQRFVRDVGRARYVASRSDLDDIAPAVDIEAFVGTLTGQGGGYALMDELRRAGVDMDTRQGMATLRQAAAATGQTLGNFGETRVRSMGEQARDASLAWYKFYLAGDEMKERPVVSTRTGQLTRSTDSSLEYDLLPTLLTDTAQEQFNRLIERGEIDLLPGEIFEGTRDEFDRIDEGEWMSIGGRLSEEARRGLPVLNYKKPEFAVPLEAAVGWHPVRVVKKEAYEREAERLRDAGQIITDAWVEQTKTPQEREDQKGRNLMQAIGILSTPQNPQNKGAGQAFYAYMQEPTPENEQALREEMTELVGEQATQDAIDMMSTPEGREVWKPLAIAEGEFRSSYEQRRRREAVQGAVPKQAERLATDPAITQKEYEAASRLVSSDVFDDALNDPDTATMTGLIAGVVAAEGEYLGISPEDIAGMSKAQIRDFVSKDPALTERVFSLISTAAEADSGDMLSKIDYVLQSSAALPLGGNLNRERERLLAQREEQLFELGKGLYGTRSQVIGGKLLGSGEMAEYFLNIRRLEQKAAQAEKEGRTSDASDFRRQALRIRSELKGEVGTEYDRFQEQLRKDPEGIGGLVSNVGKTDILLGQIQQSMTLGDDRDASRVIDYLRDDDWIDPSEKKQLGAIDPKRLSAKFGIDEEMFDLFFVDPQKVDKEKKTELEEAKEAVLEHGAGEAGEYEAAAQYQTPTGDSEYQREMLTTMRGIQSLLEKLNPNGLTTGSFWGM